MWRIFISDLDLILFHGPTKDIVLDFEAARIFQRFKNGIEKSVWLTRILYIHFHIILFDYCDLRDKKEEGMVHVSCKETGHSRNPYFQK